MVLLRLLALWCCLSAMICSTRSDVASPYRLPTKCEEQNTDTPCESVEEVHVPVRHSASSIQNVYNYYIHDGNGPTTTEVTVTTGDVCKILVHELHDRLSESGKRKEVLRLGQGIDDSKKKAVSYERSELRLIEAIHEPHICDEIKKYNVHAERRGSLRYAKGQSETMSTLHGLRDKGVKVELGIPYELWDAPNAEIGQMTRECYTIVEDHEEDIESWYWGDQKRDIVDHLCRDHVLKGSELECLDEVWTGHERLDKDSKGDTTTRDRHAKGEQGHGHDDL